MQHLDVILAMNHISKSFPGVKALDNVSFHVKRGTVHALMGENGAGKSTLMKCLFGIYQMDEGEVLFEGKPVHFHNPKDALDAGISMIHQELQPIPYRSIAENLWVGRYPIWTQRTALFETCNSPHYVYQSPSRFICFVLVRYVKK